MTDAEIIDIVENHVGMGHGGWDMVSNEELVAGFRIALSRAAPSQPEGAEPVAWMMKWPNHSPSFTTDKSDYVTWFGGKAMYPEELTPLYLHPSQSAGAAAPDEGESRDEIRRQALQEAYDAMFVINGDKVTRFDAQTAIRKLMPALSAPKGEEGKP